MTVNEWKEDFKGYINALIMPRDDYNGIMEYIDEGAALLKDQEPIKPIINEYGEAYCVCGENVGIIPNSKHLPKIRSKYCSECGRRMKWE